MLTSVSLRKTIACSTTYTKPQGIYSTTSLGCKYLVHYEYVGYRKPLILCVEKQLVGEHQEEMLKKGTSA